MAMSKIKTVYNGGAAISMIGRETDPTASTNSYVKCFHINTSIMKTTTIKLKNYHASNLLTWKLLGYVDGIGGENETITEADFSANLSEIVVEAQSYLKYSKIEFQVKSKVNGLPAKYTWEFFSTIN